jgi:hypothetical protein
MLRALTLPSFFSRLIVESVILVSCPVNSHDFRAYKKRCGKARSAGNTGCIYKGRNVTAALSVGS